MRSGAVRLYSLKDSDQLLQLDSQACGLLMRNDGTAVLFVSIEAQPSFLCFQILRPSGSTTVRSLTSLIDQGFAKLVLCCRDFHQSILVADENQKIEAPVWINYGIFSAPAATTFSRTVRITNNQNHPVTFDHAMVSCGCVEVVPNEPCGIAAGGHKDFEVNITTVGRTALNYNVLFFLTTHDKTSARLRMSILGNNVALAQLSPRNLELGSIRKTDLGGGEVLSTQLRLAETYFDRFDVSDITTDIEGLKVSSGITSRSQGLDGLSDYLIDLKLDCSDLAPGQYHGMLTVHSHDRKFGSPEIPLSFEVRPVVEVRPRQFCFGPMGAGQRESARFWIDTARRFDEMKLVGHGANFFTIKRNGAELMVEATGSLTGLNEFKPVLQFYLYDQMVFDIEVELGIFCYHEID